MSSDGSGGANGPSSAKRRGPFFEFHSTSINFWSNNPLTNLFRKSGRKAGGGNGKDGKRKKAERDDGVGPTSLTLAQQAKRSSSCDALNQPRMATRFDVEPMGGTLMRNGTSRKKKSLEHQGGAFNRGSAHSSSFSSLLHHRILLSSRGASPLVPHKIHKNGGIKIDQQQQPASKFGTNAQRRSSKSQQNIPRIIESTTELAAENCQRSIQRDDYRHRREHSLGAPPAARIHQIPILHLPSTSAASNGQFQRTAAPAPLNPVAHTFFYERRQEFVHSSQQLRKTSWEERGSEQHRNAWEEKGLELEEWMLTQPISMRRLEQHERIRLKMAGRQMF